MPRCFVLDQLLKALCLRGGNAQSGPSSSIQITSSSQHLVYQVRRVVVIIICVRCFFGIKNFLPHLSKQRDQRLQKLRVQAASGFFDAEQRSAKLRPGRRSATGAQSRTNSRLDACNPVVGCANTFSEISSCTVLNRVGMVLAWIISGNKSRNISFIRPNASGE